MLHEFVTMYREEIIERCRTKVATRSMPPPTAAEIDHGVPMFLDQLVDELRRDLSLDPAIATSAKQHGRDFRRQGFSVSQLVHDYGDICQSITELAVERQIPISTDDFRMLNRCLDDAIANAVTEFEAGMQGGQPAMSTALLPALSVHELRTLSMTALIAFQLIEKGQVGVAGSTGTVLKRTLSRIAMLVDMDRAFERTLQ
jgi:hypothetical protein